MQKRIGSDLTQTQETDAIEGAAGTAGVAEAAADTEAVPAEAVNEQAEATEDAAGVPYERPENWNIKFTGRVMSKGKLIDMEEAPAFITNGGTEPIMLPPTAVQKAGFYHEKASQLVRLFPLLYKLKAQL